MIAISYIPHASPPQVLLHTFFRRLPIIVVLCILGCSSGAEEHETFTMSSPRTFDVRNLTVVHVEPNGETVHVDWKGLSARPGDAFNVPYEEVQFSSGTKLTWFLMNPLPTMN